MTKLRLVLPASIVSGVTAGACGGGASRPTVRVSGAPNGSYLVNLDIHKIKHVVVIM